MVVGLTGWVLIALLGVLGVIVLNLLISVIRAINKHAFSVVKLPDFLSSILQEVLPLLVLVQLFKLDPTGIVLIVLYFIGAIGLIIKYLLEIAGKF